MADWLDQLTAAHWRLWLSPDCASVWAGYLLAHTPKLPNLYQCHHTPWTSE